MSWHLEEITRIQYDVVFAQEFYSHTIGLKLPVESPLSEDIEFTIIDRHLKIPIIIQSDGFKDPNDLLIIFYGRMTFVDIQMSQDVAFSAHVFKL